MAVTLSVGQSKEVLTRQKASPATFLKQWLMSYLLSTHSEEKPALKYCVFLADRMAVIPKDGPRAKGIYCSVVALTAELL